MGISILTGIFDLRSRRVPVPVFAVSIAAGTAVCILGRRELLSVAAALIPGILLLTLSVCSGGGIGPGDGLFFLAAGLFLEWKEVLVLLTVSFLLAAAVSLILILYGFCSGKSMRRKSLPFLSFTPLALLVGLYL